MGQDYLTHAGCLLLLQYADTVAYFYKLCSVSD